MKQFFSKYRVEVILFVVALLVRLFLFGVIFEHEGRNIVNTIHGDDGYYEISKSLIEGHGFSGGVPPYEPNPLRPPVYPVFIALLLGLFGSYWAPAIAQLLLGALIPVLAYRLLRNHISSEGTARWVSGFMALEPYTAFFSTLFYTETTFTVLFLSFLHFFFRFWDHASYRNAVWSGLFLALAILTKPTVQYLPVFVVGALLLKHGRTISRDVVKRIIIFTFVVAATLAPWLYRNHVEFGVVGISAQPAFNAYIYLVPSVLSLENGTTFTHELDLLLKKAELEVGDVNPANSSYYAKEALSTLVEHPVGAVKSGILNFVTFFTHDGILTTLQHAGIGRGSVAVRPTAVVFSESPAAVLGFIRSVVGSPLILVLLFRILWIIITLLFFVGALAYLVRRHGYDGKKLFALFTVFYFFFTTLIIGVGVNGRYRQPINLFILVFAVAGFSRVTDQIKKIRPPFRV